MGRRGAIVVALAFLGLSVEAVPTRTPKAEAPEAPYVPKAPEAPIMPEIPDVLHTPEVLDAPESREAPEAPGIDLRNKGRKPGGAFYMDLKRGFDGQLQLLSSWDINADWLAVSYREENARFDRSGVTLSAVRKPTTIAPYTSAELQHLGFYGYGRYEVVMRASDVPGVVSAFFVYTGKDQGDQHDEVDFEFLGRSPTQAHLNYFGQGAKDPVDVELGFNAAEGEHLYAFEWLPGSISWYADGVKLRQVTTASSSIPMPVTTGRVMASVWVANRQAGEWAGDPDFTRASAVFSCMSHVPIGKKGRQCSDTFKPPAR